MKAMYNAKLAPLLAQQEEAQEELSDEEKEEPVLSAKNKVIPFIFLADLLTPCRDQSCLRVTKSHHRKNAF